MSVKTQSLAKVRHGAVYASHGLPSEMVKFHPNGWPSRMQAGEYVSAISTLPLFNHAPETLGVRPIPRRNIALNALWPT